MIFVTAAGFNKGRFLVKYISIGAPAVFLTPGNRSMWYKWDYYLHYLLRKLEHLDPQEWLLVLVAAIFIGMVCLRGFGSRSNY